MAGFSGYVAQGATQRNSINDTTIVLAVPSERAIGDLLIACIFALNGTPPTTAAGWTVAGDHISSGGISHIREVSRIADGAEPATVTFTGGSSTIHEGLIIAHRPSVGLTAELLQEADSGSHAAASNSPLVLTTGTDANNGDAGEQLLIYTAITRLPGNNPKTFIPDTNVVQREGFGAAHGLALAAICDEGWNSADSYPVRTFTWTFPSFPTATALVVRHWDMVQVIPSPAETKNLRLLKLDLNELPYQLHTRML